MPYVKTNWVSGDIVSAEKLNNIEDGVYNAITEIEELKNTAAIIKVDLPELLSEESLIQFMQTLNNGIYEIMTEKYGYELLFISDMWQVIKGQEQEEEPELELRKEYARYTADGSSYKFDAEMQEWVMAAGGGGGGGGGGDSGASKVRVVPFPLGTPTTLNVAEGTPASIGYTYLNNVYTDGTRNLFVNDVLVNTSVISTGDHNEDITAYLGLGLNTVKVVITDTEGVIGRLTFTINVDTVVLSSTYDDATINIGGDPVIPFKVVTGATIRELHIIIDGVELPTRNLSNINGTEIFRDLTHGIHEVQMYVIGRYLNAANVELYNIMSNILKFNIIYDDSVSYNRMISSKFNINEAIQGTQLSIDYIVYDPIYELNTVELLIDGVVVNTLTVDSTRQYWSIKSLSAGTHILEIKSGDNVVTKTIEITPLEIDLDVVKDDFLKLYLTAYGKRNTDLNKNVWANSYGSPVDVQLNGLNYTSDGWVEDALRLSPTSNAVIMYKPFQTEVSAAGRTIELEFKTRYVFDSSTVLITCMANNIGFEVTPQQIILKGSNVTAVAKFKEDEHMKVTFVISPAENMIATYINGVISGVGYYNNETSFRQLTPANISLNPNSQSVDIYSIKVYDRALNQQEVLNNYIADLPDPTEKVNLYAFNDIYDMFGNPDKAKIGARIPVMMIEGNPLPTAKVKPRPLVKVTFEHPFEPSKNFIREGVEIDVQGTSSLQYPIKNFKLRFDKAEKYEMEPGMIPERIFTLKADYMDSSHSNNTGLMKLFDTIYSEGIPPEEYDSRVRTTLYGYPMILFHRVNPNDPWTFKGVYNFNLDKDAETSVGLDNEREWQEGNPNSVMPLTQSFEITFNADAGAGAFQENSLEGLISSFEPRYPEVDEFDLFEDLNITPVQMVRDIRTYLKSYTTDPDLIASINNATADTIVDLYDNEFSDIEEHEFIGALRVLRGHYANIKRAIQWVIDNNNTNTFATEFDQHFNKESAFKYLISTLVFGLVDNLGKNTMMNTWDGNVWYFNFYDIDTAMGLENQGRNIHDYDIEIGDIGAYATADSWLWANILRYFKAELDTTYSELRQNIYTYENILNFFYNQQISKIPEALYNEDSYAKYIGITTAWLWMAQGTRLAHIKRWLQLRLAFLDSKFLYGNYRDKAVAIRMNVDGYQNAYLDLTPLITQYVGVRFGNIAGGTVQVKANAHETVRIQGPEGLGDSTITNMEVWVYGAEWLTTLGDITHLNASSISIDNAPKLTELIVGGEEIVNDKLTQVSIGNNTYLETVDVTNCTILGTNVGTGSTEVLDVSGAENIKTVLAHGTQLKGVSLKPGAPITELKLPETITQLVLRDHILLEPEGLEIEGYENITTLRLENLPNIDVLEIFRQCSNVERVRILGINYSYYGISKLLELADMIYDDVNGYKIFGINANGATTDKPIIGGVVKVMAFGEISQADIDKIRFVMPNVDLQINMVIDGLQYTEHTDYVAISGYTGSATSISLPAEINALITPQNPTILGTDGWKPVTHIGFEAFKGKNILNITIPSYITNIGDSAFENVTGMTFIYLPNTLTTMGYSVFKGTRTDLVIGTNYPSKPEGWHINWNSDNREVVWGLRSTKTTFVFDSNGGNSIPNYQGTYLATLPTPARFGYNFVGWKLNGDFVTVPWFPQQGDPTTIQLQAVWQLWEYEVQFKLPDNSIYLTKYVTYGEPIGELPNDAVYNTMNVHKWIIGDTTITSDYIINRDISLGPVIIDGIFVDTSLFTCTFDSTALLYDVTAFQSTSGANGSKHLIIPATYNDGVNGEHEIRHVTLVCSNSTQRNSLGSIEIEPNTLNNRIYKNNSSTGSGQGANFTYLKTVTLPEGFIQLNTGAFKECSALTSITIPSSVTSIGDDAFQYCRSLTSITIPEGVTRIGDGAFDDCRSLTSITIPNSVTRIGDHAFFHCSALTSITIPSNVTSIGLQAFRDCSALTSITIPSSVTSIGSSAFSDCISLTSVTLERDNLAATIFSNGQFTTNADTTFYISATQNAVRTTTNLKGIISFSGDTLFTYPGASGAFDFIANIPSSVTSIGNYAFSSCISLTSVTIPNSVTSIGNYAFYACPSLASITIPNSVTSIGSYAFSVCSSLTSVTIPGSVMSIGPSAFNGCRSLLSVNLLRTTPPTLAHTSAFSSNATGRTFYIPTGTYTAYSTATNWSTFASYMEEVSI
jgi:hypothetical protein